MSNAKQDAGTAAYGIDRTVHEPARLMVLCHLYAVDAADFLFIMRQTELTQGNLSSHLSKLEAEGLITVNKEFVDKRPRTLLKLSSKGRKALCSYAVRMKQLIHEIES